MEEHYKGVILGCTIPLIMLYSLIIALGIWNLMRFYRAKQLGFAIGQIYLFSLIDSVSRIFYLGFAMKNQVWQTIPSSTNIFSNILMSIGYQSSLFSLRFMLALHFTRN